MENNLPVKPTGRASRIDPKDDNRPKIGEFYWVKTKDDESEEVGEMLMGVFHLASNHVEFQKATSGGGHYYEQIRYRDLMKMTRIEPNWRAVLDQQIEVKRIELSEAVKALADSVKGADLLPDETAAPTLLPAVTRRSPEEAKKSLIKLRDKKLPVLKKDIEKITQEITALHRDTCLPMFAETERMTKATKGIENQLFALELYAGLWQSIKQIGEGKPAPDETPITVRQMLRYMDEETLIDWDGGGMDYKKLGDFDKWIAKPENYSRILPEPRCIVAFQIRRNPKDYGRPLSIAHAFSQMEEHKANKWTYLVMRNGENVYRLTVDIEFRPRLLPMREEFTECFKNRDFENVGPDDLKYDKHVEAAKEKIFTYNRIMFLVQGLLDRSKTFSPHPPINLADGDQIARYFQAKFDEQDGLPSAHPPNWDQYRDAANAKIKPGTYVYCDEREEGRTVWNRFGSWEKRPHSTERPWIAEVKSVSRDRKKVTFRWPLGERETSEWVIDHSRPVPNKPGWYYKKKIVTNHGMKWGLQTVDMENCFNVEAYTPGDFKKFLCDAYLKGAYLEWAPELLSAEKWHHDRNDPRKVEHE